MDCEECLRLRLHYEAALRHWGHVALSSNGNEPVDAGARLVRTQAVGKDDPMALYKHLTHLHKYGGQTHEIFDDVYSPGGTVPWSGIYRCVGCGREVVHTIGKPLPPQNHHQHASSQGEIRWRLIVTDSPEPS